ncbi:MAG: hypothetical protein JST54_18880 [Deltaproteobacteria bacterium]|nr:hypothetical protein [Deltaproteobacteria bacterium]
MAPLVLAVLLAAAPATTSLHLKEPPVPAGAALRPTSPDAHVHLDVQLRLRNRDALDATIAAQHDPRSPTFRRYFTPSEFAERFGRSEVEYASLVDAFERAGLHVTRWPNRASLTVDGSAGQVQKLLGVTLLDGPGFHTFRGEGRLPANVAPLVQSVFGLDDELKPHRHMAAYACAFGGFATSPQDAVGPDDLRLYYDINPILSAGDAGPGPEVAVLGTLVSGQAALDPTQMQAFYGLVGSGAQLELDRLGPADAGTQTDPLYDLEETMDSELPTVAAPGISRVHLVLGPLPTMFTDDMTYVVNTLPQLSAVTSSFGFCEPEFSVWFSGDDVQSLADLVAQGAAEGQSWFSAAGDYGADDCGDQSGATVDLPASLPYVIAVGGTMWTGSFSNHVLAGYGQETTWNEGSYAGGGGESTLFTRPAWQTGPGTHGTQRELPDLSLMAATTPGITIVVDATHQLEACGDGTSDASPLAAGIFTAVGSKLGCRLGPPALELYRFAEAQASGTGPAAFHDITTGNITTDNITGASAAVGYDEATGLGSLDVAQLYQAYLAAGGCGAFDGGYGLLDGGNGVLDAGPAPDAGIPCHPLDSPSGCPPGLTCQPVDQFRPDIAGFCVPGCSSDGDCAPGSSCSICQHTCMATTNLTLGGPCQTIADCSPGSFCLNEENYLVSGGVCVVPCNMDRACGCPSNSQCAPGSESYCGRDCDVAAQSGCRAGFGCYDLGNGDTGACYPTCSSTTVCPVAGDVCLPTGGCAPPGTLTSASSSGSTSASGSATGSTSGSGTSSGSTSEGTTGTHGSTTGGTTTSGHGTISSGSTGASGTRGSSGCGCASGGGFDLAWMFALGALAKRKRARLLAPVVHAG